MAESSQRMPVFVFAGSAVCYWERSLDFIICDLSFHVSARPVLRMWPWPNS